MAMILRLLLVTLEEEDNLRIYDSIFWLSLIKCSYIPSPLPVLGNDGAGECRRLLHRIKMVLFREPLTCARSSFGWNHLSVPALLFVWITYICQICFFFSILFHFWNRFLCKFPILLDFCHLLYFRTFLSETILFFWQNIAIGNQCDWDDTRLIWNTATKCDAREGNFAIRYWID